MRGRDCCLIPGDFFVSATSTILRGSPLQLRVARTKQGTRKFFFSDILVEVRKVLPEELASSSPGQMDLGKSLPGLWFDVRVLERFQGALVALLLSSFSVSTLNDAVVTVALLGPIIYPGEVATPAQFNLPQHCMVVEDSSYFTDLKSPRNTCILEITSREIRVRVKVGVILDLKFELQ
ncbi:unnamed protein product [Schistocephalus solidus]|uniref:Stomatin-like protein 1 n=1 Tax=Schistocephalus solidus TaxID=70667 RepID=A0A183TA22_SCHSO|nr:unnamed protein product [Schistocephalus solidus]